MTLINLKWKTSDLTNNEHEQLFGDEDLGRMVAESLVDDPNIIFIVLEKDGDQEIIKQ